MNKLTYLPNPKYHIYIEYREPDKSGVRFNTSRAELNGAFSEPFANGEPFWFMGRLLSPVKVDRVVVFWSYETADRLRLLNGESLIAAKDKKYLIDCILKGKVIGAYVCTEEFVSAAPKNQSPPIQPQLTASPSGTPRRIIVVSGTDDSMKQTIAGALRKLGLAPIVMSEEPSQGKKIIDRFAQDYADVGFAVVLLSPDVYVYPKGEEATKRHRTPSGDVALLLGFLLGKLGKERVLAFYRESPNFAVPIDFEGVKYTALDDRDSWKLALIRELSGYGYVVDAERLLR